MASENEQRARDFLLINCDLAEHPITVEPPEDFESTVECLAKLLDEAEARGAVKWRPVSERPRPGWYLVWRQASAFGPTGAIMVGYYGRRDGSGPHVWWPHEDPDYWMPMPLPPPPSEER